MTNELIYFYIIMITASDYHYKVLKNEFVLAPLIINKYYFFMLAKVYE